MSAQRISRLRLRLGGDADEALLEEVLRLAEEAILAYTGRGALPDALAGAQLELAAVLFNRMGMEGERDHAEGGLSRTADSLPEYLRRQLNPFRLAKGVEA